MRESFIEFVGNIQESACAALLKVLVTGFFGSIILLDFATGYAQAAEKTFVNKGEVLVKQNCSRCHAIGKEGDSPHPQAPPLRILSRKYPIQDIAESLAEGIVSGQTCPSSCSIRAMSRLSSNIYKAYKSRSLESRAGSS